MKYQGDVMTHMEQPAAIKVTMKPTDLTSIIPTYQAQAEMEIAGHMTPVTFTINKLMTGGELMMINGVVESSSSDAFQQAMITGELKGKRMDFEVHGMSREGVADVKGVLQQGSDADYRALVKQIQ